MKKNVTRTKLVIRDQLAALSRTVPRMRGKGWLGIRLTKLLTDYREDKASIVTFKMRNGTIMRIDLRSRTEGWTYWTGEYDRKIIELFLGCLQPGWIAFDVGANVGFWTAPLGRRLKELGGTLYAFEPVKPNFERLVEVIELNGLQKEVHPLNLALGNEEGMIQINVEDSNHATTGNAVLSKGLEQGFSKYKVTARITCLDRLVEEQQIKACHFIKIDVEGAELMFLKGGANFLHKHRPIIYGEFNPYWMNHFGQSFKDVVEFMSDYNYRFYQQSGKGKIEFSEIVQPQSGIQDVLLIPEEKADTLLAWLNISKRRNLN